MEARECVNNSCFHDNCYEITTIANVYSKQSNKSVHKIWKKYETYSTKRMEFRLQILGWREKRERKIQSADRKSVV